jgi:hypothetical protein
MRRLFAGTQPTPPNGATLTVSATCPGAHEREPPSPTCDSTFTTVDAERSKSGLAQFLANESDESPHTPPSSDVHAVAVATRFTC